MGLLIDGKWHDEWYDTKASGGSFVRSESQFRHWIGADSKTFPAAVDRIFVLLDMRTSGGDAVFSVGLDAFGLDAAGLDAVGLDMPSFGADACGRNGGGTNACACAGAGAAAGDTAGDTAGDVRDS